MQKIIWLWKHRHCWEQLKCLYESRYALKLALSTSKAEDAEEIRDCLRDFDRVPLVREWSVSTSIGGKVEPPRPWPKRPNMPRPKQRNQ